MYWEVTKEEEVLICNMIDVFLASNQNEIKFPTTLGVSPQMLSDVLESKYGYEEADVDTNGWEWDFWWTYKNSNVNDYPEYLLITGTGASFELYLKRDEDEDE